MLIRVNVVQVCDETTADSSNTAGIKIKKLSYKDSLKQDYAILLTKDYRLPTLPYLHTH